MAELTLFLAFLAGLVSFLSPCVLPLIPAYLTFLAGTTLKEKLDARTRARIFLSSVCFVLGFSVVFSVLGVLLQSVLSSIAYDLQAFLGYIGGAIIMFFVLGFVPCYILGAILKAAGALRIPKQIELVGLDLSEYAARYAEEEEVQKAELEEARAAGVLK